MTVKFGPEIKCAFMISLALVVYIVQLDPM